jgi:AraC-like DNA-binding protein
VLRRATGLLETQPSTSLSALAHAVGLGKRTLERRFVVETGLTVGRWRQQQVLLRALEALASGRSVKQVAFGAGYSSPSAFVAAFRKHLGATPGRYFSTAAQRREVR